MNKYLIFRTDRIGDFLLTAILIKSIKRNDPNSYIKIVASEKNFNYIKSFSIVDDVILFKKGIINRFKLINSLKKDKYKAVIIHDSKKRSSFISLFLTTNLKVFSNSNNNISYFADIKNILNSLNFNYDKSDLDTLNNRSYHGLRMNQYYHQDWPPPEGIDDYFKKIINFNDSFILFHFDEKWLHKKYISSYSNIEPSESELMSLLNSIVDKTNKNVVVTTGLDASMFEAGKILINLSIDNINNKIIFFPSYLNFLDIESLIDKSELLISCHGAVSHVASAKSIRQIDIIEEKKIIFYRKWTDHFRNYKSINRKNFNLLSNEIINLL